MQGYKNVERVKLPLVDKNIKPAYITGILHLPKGTKKAPVVLWTGGVDKALVEHHRSLIDTVNNGTAVLTFDMPGAGLNNNIILELGKETEAHDAALAFVKNDSRIDNTRIAALSQSGAGIPLMEFGMKTPELKAIVFNKTKIDQQKEPGKETSCCVKLLKPQQGGWFLGERSPVCVCVILRDMSAGPRAT